MVPSEIDFFFICNDDHLNNQFNDIKNTLKDVWLKAKIIGIDPHKRGSVYVVQQIKDLLRLDCLVIVNCCDFTCYWG